VQGSARIDCQVTIEGRLTNCFLLSETPQGWSFGEAALKAATYFTFRPKLVDCKPSGGGVVIIPIRFALR
jgi:protein TonB